MERGAEKVNRSPRQKPSTGSAWLWVTTRKPSPAASRWLQHHHKTRRYYRRPSTWAWVVSALCLTCAMSVAGLMLRRRCGNIVTRAARNLMRWFGAGMPRPPFWRLIR